MPVLMSWMNDLYRAKGKELTIASMWAQMVASSLMSSQPVLKELWQSTLNIGKLQASRFIMMC
jgi:hypothetical protein